MISALGDTIILEKIKVEETTEGGLILNSNDFTPLYKVVSVSDNLSIENTDGTPPVKTGDIVLIHRNAGGTLKWEDKVYKTVKSWEIEAIVDSE